MSYIKLLFLIPSVTAIFAWYPKVYNRDVPRPQTYHGVHDGFEHANSFNNEWTVQIDGGEEIAQLVALEFGYVYGGPVLGFPNTYVFTRYEHSKQRRTPSEHTLALVKDRRVRWAEQLFTKTRVKRYPMPEPDDVINRVKRIDDVKDSKNDKRTIKPLFNDELWGQQWYLQDTRTAYYQPRLDLNVLPVYAMGFNGWGIRVSILDDGIEHNHTDLHANYDPEISWDSNDHDSDPTPRYEKRMHNSHGTRCAGEIAMTANNGKCGVGVAWGAKVGGVRMLDGRITDRIEGEALAYAWDKVDIYSASWGPNDDGRTVEGPGRLALEAFERGILQGRGGKGAIYVWANGNGGKHNDNCNCDGYSSSIYTISIGSASQHGLFPWYGETCSSTLACAYSSGAYRDQKITTTDTGDSCTVGHTGTSAAAPLAAGIIALALQANPNLTWRDVQHLIVWTSEYMPLSANAGWQINGVGLRFDVRFGFGLMNAGALVATALNWTTVPQKHQCAIEASPLNEDEGRMGSQEIVKILIAVEDCVVNYLEHVELVVNIQYSRRGALEIYLTSPQGTKIQLLSPRPRDKSKAGFVDWPLVSVGQWGENPNGVWTAVIIDKTTEKNTGVIGKFSLILHGTMEAPAHMLNGPRKYNYNYTYQEVFDYIESIKDDVTPSIAVLPEENKLLDKSVNAQILDEVEKELLRVHHRKNDMSVRF